MTVWRFNQLSYRTNNLIYRRKSVTDSLKFDKKAGYCNDLSIRSSLPPILDEAEIPLTDALVAGLRKLELHQSDITAEDVTRALADKRKKALLTPREIHAITMSFTEIDLKVFDDEADMPPADVPGILRGLTRSALRGMHERGLSLFAPKDGPGRQKK